MRMQWQQLNNGGVHQFLLAQIKDYGRGFLGGKG